MNNVHVEVVKNTNDAAGWRLKPKSSFQLPNLESEEFHLFVFLDH